MRRILIVFLPVFFLLLVSTSCTGSWGYYSKTDRNRAHANGLPYWEDILRNCFPDKIGEMTIDRSTDPIIAIGLIPPIMSFYDSEGEKFKWGKRHAPKEFAGYRVIVGYRPKNRQVGEISLTFFLIYSTALVEKQRLRINNYYEGQNLTIGEFDIFKGESEKGEYEWAFYDDDFCICTYLSDGLDGEHSKMFETLVGQLDVECIKSQLP